MQTALLPSYRSSGWGMSIETSAFEGNIGKVPLREVRIAPTKRPLIMRKRTQKSGNEMQYCRSNERESTQGVHRTATSLSATKPMLLYPVKKVLLSQQSRSFQDAAKQRCIREERSTSIDYEVPSLNPFKVLFSRRPLLVARPLGDVVNLQAPDGSRAATPLLFDSCEFSDGSSPSSQGTVSSWGSRDLEYVGKMFESSSPISSSFCHTDAYGEFVSTRGFDPSSSEERIANLDVKKETCPNIALNEDIPQDHPRDEPKPRSTQPPQYLQHQNNCSQYKGALCSQCIESAQDSGMDAEPLLSSSFSLPERFSPNTERYLSALDQHSPLKTVNQYCHATVATHQEQRSFSQNDDIDYAILDEFFVRS